MRGYCADRAAEAREIERSILRGTATICRPKFGRVCKALWPYKTAEELATRTKRSVRAAGYEISGEQEPSARSLVVLINEIMDIGKAE